MLHGQTPPKLSLESKKEYGIYTPVLQLRPSSKDSSEFDMKDSSMNRQSSDMKSTAKFKIDLTPFKESSPCLGPSKIVGPH